MAREQRLSAPAFLDRMLLCLFDALWLKQSEDWSNRGVANMCAEEPYETADLKRRTSPWPSTTLSEGWVRMLNLLLSVNRIAKWFLRGQNVGRKPLYDGICAQCGCLLYGTVSHHSALSNKVVGPPTNRDGMILTLPDGAVDSAAQPPFLLRCLPSPWEPVSHNQLWGQSCAGGFRFSPQLFAKEAPEMFHHDPETNRLWLTEGKREPWLRDPVQARGERVRTWLYRGLVTVLGETPRFKRSRSQTEISGHARLSAGILFGTCIAM